MIANAVEVATVRAMLATVPIVVVAPADAINGQPPA
jgi:hypothetical protein